jgi:methylphosphotriester-DNA--protein-cysteine methyltransferase
MSLSIFHRHFKAVNTMNPLQYPKMIRLRSARTQLVIENHEATEVAYSVRVKPLAVHASGPAPWR